MPSAGGDALPISYGDYDNTNPRWSPDGTKIAFISNRGGNTSLWIQTIPGGAQTQLAARERKYLKHMGQLWLGIVGPNGKPMAARIFVTAADGRAYAPDDAWMHADDSFTRSERPFEAHYFDTAGTVKFMVPAGPVQIGVMRGFEFGFEQRTVGVVAGTISGVTIHLRPNIPYEPAEWVSGDVHVHMNYAGTYRNTPAHLIEQAASENLAMIENLVVNKEQRFPDIAVFSPKMDAASNLDHLLLHGQEFHTSYWGHLGLLGLKNNLILPGYAGYPNTAASSLYPANLKVADMAHAQGALVGYVHPLESVPDPSKDDPITYELPADVALGKVDYIEVVGFADHKSTAEVWYKLLNCGFRLPTAAGTDFMGNYASLRGPIGLNRVYAQVKPGPLKIEPWLASIKAGRTFATNGPLLWFELGGKTAGGEIQLAKKQEVPFKVGLRSIVPLDHLQIVCNGKVAREIELKGDRKVADASGTIALDGSGWCVLRAYSDQAEYPILDLYPYATTSPVYVSMVGAPLHSPADAAYFRAWVDRLITAAMNNKSWNTEAEKQSVIAAFQEARNKYETLSH
jgi:TolB protein